MELLVASNNKKKLKELKEMLSEYFEVFSFAEKGIISEPEETGKSFAENSVIKARAAMEKSGLCSFADDSGLSVDALNGAPGVYSARYSGTDGDDEKNNRLLLKNLEGITNRHAKFICSVTLIYPNNKIITASGECEGEILTAPRGVNGFGYDPLFYVPAYGKTFAELDGDIKNKISHRAKALENFMIKLNSNNN
jgi:XTP/dITP diphosphohydrolase